MGRTRGVGFPRPPREVLSAVLTRGTERRGIYTQPQEELRGAGAGFHSREWPRKGSLLGGAFLAELRASAPRELEKFSQRRG